METRQYQKASYTQRFWAYIIDQIIIILYMFTFYRYLSNNDEKQYLIYILLLVPIIWIYLFLHGQTIGKFIFKIKIVDRDTSEKPSIDSLFIRSIIKWYSVFNSFLYGKEVPVHEDISETKVIRLKNKIGIKV
ncbi:MAG: hypothetical protein K0Q49_2393, partial [Haloplasmataceae bacterium]|nr:hypothetical protein [Haloplasmataceae bacterium]